MSTKFNWTLFNDMPVVGIMRNFPPAQLAAVAEAYESAGLTALEITMNSPGAADTIRQLREEWGERMNIGAGTVCTMKDLEAALEAGSQFIVTPITERKVIKTCAKEDIPVFAGAFTPTEIFKAWKWGATMVKVFPAGRLGPAYLKDVREPLNKVKLMPTGGVSPDNFTDFLRMGASAVGMASALFPKDLITAGDVGRLRVFYQGIVQKYRDFISEKEEDERKLQA